MNKRDSLERGGVPAVRENTEGVGFSNLAEAPVTRARAMKLFGATIAGGALMAILPDEADARRRKRRRRRRRRRARVNQPTPVTLVPGDNTISITNPSPDKPLTISGVKVIDSDGSVISTRPLVGGPITLQPGQTLPVTVNLGADDLLNADGLRLIDGGGVPITVVDENGVVVGDIDVA